MGEKSEIKTLTLKFIDMLAPNFKPAENTRSVVRVFRTTEPEKGVAKKKKIIYFPINNRKTYGRKNETLF